ncbi:hypothetical protein V3851_05355 [Paenibacillus sp. M1]|uniref:Uncharacterized protein n=1 Tax=Paenibacillus haidiansis TaxID=1574488 RepID=A0ABU7VPL4_9BACL
MTTDLSELHGQFNGDRLALEEPTGIEQEWREAVRSIVLRNDGFELYERMKVKYGFDADEDVPPL